MLLFRIVSDSASGALMSYSMGVDLVDAPRQLHREQTAPISTASGLLLPGVKRCCELLHVARGTPNETKRPTYKRTKMKTFLSLFAAYVAAGAFGVAVVHNASESLQQSFTHSGTQRYVRVVR